jgi:superfamily II DNA or RNA helicase
MAEEGYITPEACAEAQNTPLETKPKMQKESSEVTSWYADMVVLDVIRDLMGETVCDIGITDLAGDVLAPYRTCRIPITLSPAEQSEYNAMRAIYTKFLRSHSISFSRPGAWGEFIIACSRYPGGKAALQAFAAQRKIARNSQQKYEVLADILHRHSGERIIIFTADNDTAYQIGRNFVLPVLTHHTKAAERKAFLENFRHGTYPVLVTSKVLNEGVDVPDAAVGVVLSGSGSVREHVQRLGRILRTAPGKEQAVLYELVSANTSEESISDRRREHNAYRRRN